MTISQDIKEFVTNIEVFSKRKLHYPLEVSEILQIAVQTGFTKEFEELIFQTKFLVRTQDVMTQIGREAQGFEKLSIEFQSGISKSMDLLKMLVERADADVAQKYLVKFFALETESIPRLMNLYSDLSWIKNWQIDGKQLPYETKSPKKENTTQHKTETHFNNQSIKILSGIQKSSLLSAILFVLFLLIDPPVTVLGWIISLWIAVLLMYIVIQILFLTKKL